MDSALAALLGAAIGGVLSVVASWLLYSEFVQGTVRCYADALQHNEPDPGRLANVYGEIGRMRIFSSEAVVAEAEHIARRILKAYADQNRDGSEVRDYLATGSLDLFWSFSAACRAELGALEKGRTRLHS